MKKTTSLFFLAAIFSANTLVAQQKKAASATDQKMNTFINNLMSKMTVDEKIGQLNLPAVGFDVTGPILSQGVDEKIEKGLVGGVFNTFTPQAVLKLQKLAMTKSRLKIPLLFGYDVVHGHKTIFPIPLGLSASWDMDLIEKSARIAAREASADGLNWTFSPMVDIARDPRWGRISEGSGEDPYLGSLIGAAMVRGYQTNSLSNKDAIMASVKHFALYGAAEGGRDYNTTDMSLIRMYNEYLPPYKAAIDAGAETVMVSFNDINGTPATANKWLLTDLLRKDWGFKGFVVSDYTGVSELIAHGLGDLQTVSAKALDAGTDMDMVSEGFLSTLKQSLKEKKITQEVIDIACRRILESKYKLGLFEDPYKYVNEERAKTEILSAQNRLDAKNIAAASMVLLKNNNQLLPLKKNAKIALIGPLADNKRDMIGNWSAAGDWKKAISVIEGLKNVAPDMNITYAKGANLVDDAAILKQINANGADITADAKSPKQLIDEAVAAAKKSDIAVVVLGESAIMGGEATSRTNLDLLPNQKDLLKALSATGKPIVLVLMNSRPLTLEWEDANVPAILETWFSGTEAGNAIADVLVGNYNPSGKLTATFPRNVGQIPLYYNHKSTGRPYDGVSNEKFKSRYIDSSNDPLYPFGFGLSYTNFTFSPVKLDKSTLKSGQTIKATVEVKNTGNFDGHEIVQLYIQDIYGSVTRPVKELKGFQKIFLKKGESKEVTFTIDAEMLKFYNTDLKFAAESGDFNVFIGSNSRDVSTAKFGFTL
ncbi:beta-glucosidase [Pedobacter cryoconitis]|uniref:Periplasmic beta-glucosidase n=1 Tax=Pedobacter cryoconitis TaxID=188932 RepID=A0A7W8ZM19_9SPHI|nr:beta-glucosidase BglX [Pedobacter cryoconitis]MBB5636330.1 beta-glucosidase [Pedobacter cryoconitis]MBB6274613.1 beta-glucosidase [Pedobacter cryoconitis]